MLETMLDEFEGVLDLDYIAFAIATYKELVWISRELASSLIMTWL